jgi:excisionase family DNA binding protein
MKSPEVPQITPPVLLEMSAALVRLAAAIHADAEQTSNDDDSAEERLLTMPQVAERLNVPEAYARELGRLGELPTVRLGTKYVRVRASDLSAWIRERTAATRDAGGPPVEGRDARRRPRVSPGKTLS